MFSTLTKSGLIRSVVCLFALIHVPSISHTQVVQDGRLEININSTVESYSVVSLDSAGIALYRILLAPKKINLSLYG